MKLRPTPWHPCAILLVLALSPSCARAPEGKPQPSASTRNLVLITIDTLRADRIGAYGYAPARTPAIDSLAARGARFDRAYATAPITLTSHASVMSGRYPAGHGARHNGLRVDAAAPLLADTLARAGFSTAAFVTAFPLDRRFGLDKGFQVYSDRMPRTDGKIANERPGDRATTEALSWLKTRGSNRFFLWLHLFEPHAPYGAPGDPRPAAAKYDDEVQEADRQVARLIEGIEGGAGSTLFVITADHGEAFGEHGEIAHSIFVYDTTLRVPLIFAGPGISPHVVDTPVSLIDIAPTVLRLLGVGGIDADGVDLGPALSGGTVPERTLYAESFAPLLDFGWSPLRALREHGWKYIDAPRPELYRVQEDGAEARDVASAEKARVEEMRSRVQRYSPAELERRPAGDAEAMSRLQSLGYVGGSSTVTGNRPDPKDRRAIAADIARVTSGELRGAELEATLRRILAADRRNPQANMRLGFALQESGRCAEAIGHFNAAIEAGIPGADAHLGLAFCHVKARRVDAAVQALQHADRAEPGNAVVAANLGIVLSDNGRPAEGVPHLQRAVDADPDFHQARFNLAIAFARLGRRADAFRQTAELLKRLPADAPQRAEVERLAAAVK